MQFSVCTHQFIFKNQSSRPDDSCLIPSLQPQPPIPSPASPLSLHFIFLSFKKKRLQVTHPDTSVSENEVAWKLVTTPEDIPPGMIYSPGVFRFQTVPSGCPDNLLATHNLYERIGLAAEVCFKIKYLNTMYKPCTINSVSRSCPLHLRANSMLHNAKHKCKL